MNRSLVGLVIISTFLAATNPSHRDYADYVVQTMQAQCQHESLLMPEKLACGAFTAAPQSWKTDIVQIYSQRRNYLLFSAYSLKVGTIHYRYIGIGGHFLRYETLRETPLLD